MWRLAFVLLGIGFAGSSASWFAAARRSRARARYLQRTDGEEPQARYWRAVMAKDNLIGGLFLAVAIAIVELSNAIFEFIEVFYNRRRRHSQIGYMSPLEFEQALLTEQTA